MISHTIPAPILIDKIDVLIDSFDLFCIDLWGVLHNGQKAFGPAVRALEKLKRAKKIVALLSNAPRRVLDTQKRLAELGIAPHLYEHIVTSGEETWWHLHHRPTPWYQALGEKVYYVGPDRHLDLMDDTAFYPVSTIEEADFILNTGIDQWGRSLADYDDLFIRAKNLSMPMICANPDKKVVYGNELYICAGALAAEYNQRGGEVVYHGKPFSGVYQRVFAHAPEVQRGRILAIGDSFATDMRGACQAGMVALLIEGGVHKDEFIEVEGDSEGKKSVLQRLMKTYEAYPSYHMSFFQ